MLIETLFVYALYYAYARIAQTDLPLPALVALLVIMDRAVEAIRARLSSKIPRNPREDA